MEDGILAIRNDLDKAEKWFGETRMKFNEAECKVLRLRTIDPLLAPACTVAEREGGGERERKWETAV